MAKAREIDSVQSSWDLSLENWTKYFLRKEKLSRYQLFMKVDSLGQLPHALNRVEPIHSVITIKWIRFI